MKISRHIKQDPLIPNSLANIRTDNLIEFVNILKR